MAMESPVKMVSSLGMIGVRSDNINKNPDNANYDDYAKELGLLLKDRTRVETIQREKEREVHFHRSGSAPPSVEGSLAAIGGLFPQHSMEPTYFPEETDTATSHPLEAEEQLRSDPAYLTYYYSNVNLNPRLPPPLISRENWKLAQWLGAVREKGNLRSMDDSGSRSLFSSQPVFASQKEELKTTLMDGFQPLAQGDLLRQRSTKWAQGGGDGLIGLSPSGLGARCKSFADLIQEEFPVRASHSPVFHLSRPSSRATHEDVEDPVSEFNARSASITTPVLGSSRSSTPNPLNQGNLSSNGFTTSSTPGRAASPAFGLGAQSTTTIERPLPRNASITASSSLAAALQNLSVSDIPESSVSPEKHFTRGEQQQEERWRSQASYHGQPDSTHSSAYAQALLQLQLQQQLTLNPNMYSAAMSYMDGNISSSNNNPYYQNSHLGSSMYSPNYGLENYNLNSSLLPSMMMGGFPGTLPDSSRAVPSGTSLGADMQHLYKMGSQANTFDPSYIQYLQQLSQDTRVASAKGGYVGGSAFADFLSMQKINNSLLTSGSPLVSPAVPSGTHSGPLRSPWLGSSWPGDTADESRICSLLEEFKNSKTKCFELSDIVGKVAEFSVDQHGSRFIQQKLEVANPDEKALVFQEIFPRALTLMTDVFGNYVIQKFFEYGTPQQKTELANQLVGHVLSLSLQMYGCRVIQKAIEALDVDQQTWLVSELDGNVIRCVRDQNGNHVIQKCIECIPQDRIRFIISAFFGQVVTLSTHPYGCRVIQRVLENCSDEETQERIMDEILQSVCNLSHDQYGNYVVQHILEHGKPHERSDIVKKIAGQFVQMSQHKFASNVVEKCLEFGSQVERQILINEMLGDMEENEPLQAMMKDQFANYVVQKVLETCDERQRGILLARIKLHLHSLKKYTYGKHIVARVEKLVVAAERQNANHLAQKALI